MRTADLITTAFGNTLRSRARTVLTILAIFVGAFTLTITSGIGTGISRYIDDTVAGFGASDVMSVTRPSDDTSTGDDGPREYDPDTVSAGNEPGPMSDSAVTALTQADIDTIADIDGVEEVEPAKSVSVDYVQFGSDKKFTIGAGTLVPGQSVQLADGEEADNDADDYQLVLPVSYVEPLGFDDNDDAVDQTIKITLTDADYKTHTVEAKVVGLVEEGLNPTGASSFVANSALTDRLFTLQSLGLPAAEQNRWAQANVWFADNATDQEIADLQARLDDAGYDSVTVADQLGAFTTVIDTIVLVLNGFAVIALIAAGFGIVNTLLMSVQERTREIGLMKAFGMRSGRIFALFSIEAAFIGFLGSAIGVVVAMVAGTVANGFLSGALLSDLPGLTLFAFDPLDVLGTILLIVVVAFLAGTLPAVRAARKDPVDALRYE